MKYSIKTISRGLAGSNCYICSQGKDAFLIDPGCDIKHINRYLEENELQLKFVFITHAHYDHIFSLDILRNKYPFVTVYAHEKESISLTDPVTNGSIFFGSNKVFEKADGFVAENSEIEFCGEKIKILHTPGHTSGGICIIFLNNVFTGDTLFRRGIGRSDLPGGNSVELDGSLKKLMQLPGGYRIFPGHGSSSNIEDENNNNPFLLGAI